MHGLGPLLIGAGEDFDLVGDHERRIETQTEVADDGLVLVFGHELLGTRERNLVDVLVDLVGRHADAAVGDGERLMLLVGGDAHGEVAQLALHLADGREGLELLGGVHRIGNQLAQKDFVV